jgi:hypothetical protein
LVERLFGISIVPAGSLALLARFRAAALLLIGLLTGDKAIGSNRIREDVFRVTLESGHCSMQSACLKRADTVAKVVLQKVSKFQRAAASIFV